MSNTGLISGTTPEIGGMNPGKDQLSLSEKPRRYSFRIMASDSVLPSMIRLLGRPMYDMKRGIVDQATLVINPQVYKVSEPTREGITQTVGGAWLDWYGLGLPKIYLAGTTGWKPDKANMSSGTSRFALVNASIQSRDQRYKALRGDSDPNSPTGLQNFIYLRNRIFRTYAFLLQKSKLKFSQRAQDQLQLQFFAWDTEDYYVVAIDLFELQRSVARPLLYDYNVQMTVLGYVGDRGGAIGDFLAVMRSPTKRLTGIRASLQTWSYWANRWQGLINSISVETGKLVSDITKSIDQISQDVENVAANTASFITTPLKAVRQVTTDIRNLGDAILSVSQMPERFKNEFHNQLLETWCALSGLTAYPSLFKQTFQDTFNGAPWANLNCSSTLSIPPDPTQPNPGVILPVADIPPRNFDDVSGTQSPVRGSSVSPNTTPYRVKEVAIMEGDTVESVILKIGGLDQDVAQVWQQIATLNGLEYPYIAPSTDFQAEVQAIGTVTFYGTPTTSIPSGTRVGTQPSMSNSDIIIFRTQSTAVIGADGKATVSVKAEKPGDFANLEPLSISIIVSATGEPTTISGVSSVENSDSTSGGKIYNILKPGQKLMLPVGIDATQEDNYVEQSDLVEDNLFGSDVALDADGDFVADNQGDLLIVSGIENISAAVIDRLVTNRGELIKHPEYGLNTAQMIGEPGDANYIEFAKMELQSTILQDSRIVKINNLVLVKSGETLEANMNLILIDETVRPTAVSLPTP